MYLADESLKAMQFSNGGPELVLWRTQFYDVEVIFIAINMFFLLYSFAIASS